MRRAGAKRGLQRAEPEGGPIGPGLAGGLDRAGFFFGKAQPVRAAGEDVQLKGDAVAAERIGQKQGIFAGDGRIVAGVPEEGGRCFSGHLLFQ